MKTIIVFVFSLILTGVSCMGQITNNMVTISDVVHDPDFGDYVIVQAVMLPNHNCQIQASSDPQFTAPYVFAAYYGCPPEPLFVSGTFPIGFFPATFFRSVNYPCP